MGGVVLFGVTVPTNLTSDGHLSEERDVLDFNFAPEGLWGSQSILACDIEPAVSEATGVAHAKWVGNLNISTLSLVVGLHHICCCCCY